MAFDRELWSGTYDPKKFPNFPCPKCSKGRAKHDGENVKITEPTYSATDRRHPDWEPGWDVERFSLQLICDNTICGEVIVVTGETSLVEFYDEDDERWEYFSHLRPRSMFPAPPIINIPTQAPRNVVDNIRLASSHYWLDTSAAANRLRASVEFLLDFLQVPRETINSTTGKAKRTDLNGRIAHYELLNAEHAPSLTALRIIGNLGSHGEDVQQEVLLDALEVYEYTLDALCGQRKDRIEALRQKLISTKGKYSQLIS
ncbi:DUF4145 domain-containing protein [Xanthomonas sp. LF06-19]|uniref:DUF4145 domain-containing protein n=1 Tax=Xanthomonas sp. LF06-19 TaxID=3097551 RepID=UPI002A825D51|nr:DUF4145 domain-containing protein [Xanthomonas sp. LF06-19]MDY4284368.1 DUF4145 domain-containing protein [Xanthomonas sp. LF06-19]